MRIPPGITALFALGLLGCGGDAERIHTVSGTVDVPGVALGTAIQLHAQTLLGEPLGSTTAATGETYTLTFPAPADQVRVLLGAVVLTDLERRALAVVELTGTGTMTGALGEEPVSLPQGTPVDARTTAEAVLRSAAGRLDLPPGDFATRHASSIGELADGIALSPPAMCSIGATGTTNDTADLLGRTVQQVVAAEPPRADGGPEVLRQMKEAAARTNQTVEQRLRAMQQIASYYVYSLNLPRLPGDSDTLIGIMPTVLMRLAIYGMTGESLNELSDRELSRDELTALASIVGSLRWGNCREKAYLGAYAASLVPEIRQIVVVGVELKGVGAHALAIGCLDGPEVYDLSAYGGTILAPPKGAEGRCFIIDPWLPPLSDFQPGKGHVAVLSQGYVTEYNWESVFVNKPIRLDGTVQAPLGETSGLVCAGSENGEPSCTAPAQPTGGPDAGSDAGGECPVYVPDGKSCGAQLDGCIEGFYCSTETIACEQTTCPEGAGRTYTLECCCNCWDDKSLVNVYDPCRAGFLLRCDPAPGGPGRAGP